MGIRSWLLAPAPGNQSITQDSGRAGWAGPLRSQLAWMYGMTDFFFYLLRIFCPDIST